MKYMDNSYREKKNRRLSEKELRDKMHVEFDRCIDRLVVGLRNNDPRVNYPVSEHITRALEYVVSLRSLTVVQNFRMKNLRKQLKAANNSTPIPSK